MILKYRLSFCLLSFLLSLTVLAQRDFIYTKEGRIILSRRQLINNCLQSLNKDRKDETALSICACQANKIDRRFTLRQYRKYNRGTVIDLNALVKEEDSVIAKQIEDCYKSTGKTILLSAEGFGNEFISNCVKSIQKNTERTLDPDKLNNFCSCELDLIKTKKLTDAEIETLSNPNSILFYEVMYKCGDPYEEKQSYDVGWTGNAAKDITGPATDTINILTLRGMTYVKIKTGSLVQFWLFDTGAADLLINKDMETDLKKEGIITESN